MKGQRGKQTAITRRQQRELKYKPFKDVAKCPVCGDPSLYGRIEEDCGKDSCADEMARRERFALWL